MVDDSEELSLGLQGFGLTEYEAKMYVALLESGSSTVNQLQYASRVPRTKLYSVAVQLKSKGLIREIEGKPVRFQALSPDVFQNAIVDGEKRVKVLKRVLSSLKKAMDRKVLPQDALEERYLSLGSQSLLMQLRESILRAQESIECVADGWGLHLVKECSEELDAVSRQDVEIRVVSAVPPSPLELGFSSSRMRLKYGKHLSGRSVFIFDRSEVFLVNSQTGRGYRLYINELTGAFGEVFEECWRGAADASTLNVLSPLSDEAVFLTDSRTTTAVFVEAVSRAVRDDRLVAAIGSEFLELMEERIAPRLRGESLESAMRIISKLMAEELGEAAVEYDPLTKTVRIELSDANGGTPNSMWYFALAGLLKKMGFSSEVLQDAVHPEAKSRVIQARMVGQRPRQPGEP